MKKKYSLLALILFLNFANSNAQAFNCGNVGLESGDNTGWSGYAGNCTTGPSSQLPTLQIPTTPVTWTTNKYYRDTNLIDPNYPFGGKRNELRWSIMSPDSGVNGYDPLINSIPVVSPWGGSYSIRLGNRSTNNGAESLSFDYKVDSSNASFVYQYAIILQNPTSHYKNQQSAFRINITDTSGTLVNPTCGSFSVYADDKGAGLQKYNHPKFGQISYRNWSLASVDLTSYIGQTLKIEFATNDCSLYGHFGYAYIDCSCVPLAITTTYCNGSPKGTVFAPVGFNNYNWRANANINYPLEDSTTIPPTKAGPVVLAGSFITNLQFLDIASNDTLTNYTVTCIPQQGLQCAIQLNYTFNKKQTLKANFADSVFCGNMLSKFYDNCLVINNGTPPQKWLWDFGDGDTSTAKNPTHQFPVLLKDSAYNVTFISQVGNGCKDTAVNSVIVPASHKAYVSTTAQTCSKNGELIVDSIKGGKSPYIYHCAGLTFKNDTLKNLSHFYTYSFESVDSIGCIETLQFTVPLKNDIDTTISYTNGELIANADSSITRYKWKDCMHFGETKNDTLKRFSPLVSGYYKVVLKQLNCSATTDCFIVDLTSVNDISNIQEISILPNPNNGKFLLKFNTLIEENIFVEVIDMLGQKIITKAQCINASENNISLEINSKGIYTVSIKTNSEIVNKLIVVE